MTGSLILGMATLAILAGVQEAPAPHELNRRTTLDPDFQVAACRLVDLNGDGTDDVLLIGRDGRVRTFDVTASPPTIHGELDLPRPRRSLLALVAMESGSARPELVVLGPRGAMAYGPGERAGLGASERRLSSRARFRLRAGAPTFSNIVQDVNRDGWPDLIVPDTEMVEVWLRRVDEDAAPDAAPRFERAARVAVRVRRWGSWDGEFLSNRLESSFTVPALSTRDVNGDGRPDLWVNDEERRGFHLQREDGTFPPEPDVVVDLTTFRDTSPRSELRPGRTLALKDRAHFESRELNGDGVLDFAVAHRRKVWVFPGTPAGPQFTEPSAILKAAEDITALTLVELDDDGFQDLLLVKVQIPTIATLIRGLFGEWEVTITSVGYKNRGDASFSTEPDWRSELNVRLPSILELLRRPGEFIDRFEDLDRRFRVVTEGDFNGDGLQDVVLVGTGGERFDVWIGRAQAKEVAEEAERDLFLRRLLLGEEDRDWDLEGIYGWLGGLAERRAARITGGRTPDAGLPLRDPASWVLTGLVAGDLDGDGRDEILAEYVEVARQERSVYDVLAFR